MKKQTKNQNLPKVWRKVKLGEVAGVLGGFAFKSEWFNVRGIGYPIIKIQNIVNGLVDITNAEYVDTAKAKQDVSKFRLHKGDFLIAMTGATAGKIGRLIEEVPCYLNQRVGKFYLKNENKLDKKFFYYSVINKKNLNLLKKLADGSAQGNMSSSQIENTLEISFPKNINEQKRIASILSAFDEKIELNNKINQTLEQIAQAIFKEWFVKNQNPPKKSLRLPTGQTRIKNQKLGDLVEIISGYPFSSKLYTKNKKALGVVTIKNVQDGNFIPACNSFISEENIPKNMNSECRIKDGDILLSLTGNVGRVCFLYGGEYLLNQRVAKLKPKLENDRAFCYFLFRQPMLQNQLINMAKGSAQPNLSPVETGEIVLDIPSREALDKFNEILNLIYNRLIQNMVENQKLAELRDFLLPKLMSGEIRV